MHKSWGVLHSHHTSDAGHRSDDVRLHLSILSLGHDSAAEGYGSIVTKSDLDGADHPNS